MQKVYVINIECKLDFVETIFDTLQQGFNTFDKAKEYVLNKLIPSEETNSWIKNYEQNELEITTHNSENSFVWECIYNDYELYTIIKIEEIEIN